MHREFQKVQSNLSLVYNLHTAKTAFNCWWHLYMIIKSMKVLLKPTNISNFQQTRRRGCSTNIVMINSVGDDLPKYLKLYYWFKCLGDAKWWIANEWIMPSDGVSKGRVCYNKSQNNALTNLFGMRKLETWCKIYIYTRQKIFYPRDFRT